jgi:hypothetical protein
MPAYWGISSVELSTSSKDMLRSTVAVAYCCDVAGDAGDGDLAIGRREESCLMRCARDAEVVEEVDMMVSRPANLNGVLVC